MKEIERNLLSLSATFLMETLIYIRRQPNYRSRQTKADNCDFNAVQSFREHSEELWDRMQCSCRGNRWCWTNLMGFRCSSRILKNNLESTQCAMVGLMSAATRIPGTAHPFSCRGNCACAPRAPKGPAHSRAPRTPVFRAGGSTPQRALLEVISTEAEKMVQFKECVLTAIGIKWGFGWKGK